jgi:hypothetical protein
MIARTITGNQFHAALSRSSIRLEKSLPQAGEPPRYAGEVAMFNWMIATLLPCNPCTRDSVRSRGQGCQIPFNLGSGGFSKL